MGKVTQMQNEKPGVLIGDFIKKRLKIEEGLQKRIDELEKELKNIQGKGDENDYLLYKEILNFIIPNISITYNGDDGQYYLSVSPTTLPLEHMTEIVNEMKKFQERNDDLNKEED